MIKTYCDRCGVDMTPKKPKFAPVTFQSLLSFAGTISGKFYVDNRPPYKIIRTDDKPVVLCKKCEKAFREFMNGPEESRDGKNIEIVVADEEVGK